MLRDKRIIFALLFYLCAFIADASVTTNGILSGRAGEGDPLVLYLWSIFGTDSFLLKIIYVILIFSVSYILYKKFSKFLGLFLPLSLGVGHILGFSTWLPFYFRGFNFINELNHSYGITGIFIVAPLVGFCLTFLIKKR